MPPRRKTVIRMGPCSGVVAGVEAGAAKARTDGTRTSAVDAARKWRRTNMTSPRLESRRHGAVGQHAPGQRQGVLAIVESHARLQPQALDNGHRDLRRRLG